MKVYVINLDRRPDRLAKMTERLNALGLEFERVSAFDGKYRSKIFVVDWVKAYIYNYLVKPSLGQIGCFNSHREVWRRMLAQGESRALVFEDDAEPIDWDPKILDVDLVAIGIDQLRLERLDNPVRESFDPEEITHEILGRKIHNILSFGSAAYVITRSGAEKMLGVGKFWFNIDHYDMWTKVAGLRTVLLLPEMWKQSGSESDIAQVELQKTNVPVERRVGFALVKEILWRMVRPAYRLNRKILEQVRSRLVT